MDNLEIDGFLSRDITHWIEKHHTENKAWFELAEEINRFAQEQMLKLDIHNNDYQELLVAAGLFRTVSSFQGTYVLLERGMIFEAGTQLRGQIESMFVVAAAANEREFAHRYILSDGVHKLRLMKNLLNSNDEIKAIVDTSVSWKEVVALKDQLKADNINDIQIKNIAIAAGYLNWYTVVYTYLSQMAAHPTPLSLDSYLFAPDGKTATEFLWGPDVIGISSILSSAIESLVIVLKKVSIMFAQDWSAVLDSIHGRLVALTKPEDDIMFGFKDA
jgi:hypothetical protein